MNDQLELANQEENPQSMPEAASKLALEKLPIAAKCLGRDEELSGLQERLNKYRWVSITGMLGIGKSTLGAELSRQYNVPSKRKIWLTFRRGLKDKVEAVIWSIGAALAQDGDMRYWNFLEQDIELKQHYPFSVKVGLLLHYLEQSPSLLCLDQLEVIEDDPVLRSTLVELVERLHFDSNNPVRLITMGRYIPAFLRDDQSLVLSGLKFDAVVQMVDQENTNCSQDVLELLFDKTSGNPYLIKSFLKYTKLQGISPSLELINAYWDVFISVRAELEDYLIDMRAEQQSMMEALSVFRTVIPSRLFRQEFLIDDDFIPSQGRVMTELIMHSWVQQVGYGQLLRLSPLFRDLWQDKGLERDRERMQRLHKKAVDFYGLQGVVDAVGKKTAYKEQQYHASLAP